MWRRQHMALQKWIGSRFGDTIAADEAALAMRDLLANDPLGAQEIGKLALGAAFIGLQAGEFEPADRFAQVGMDAGAIVLPGQPSPLWVFVALAAAQAQFAAARLGGGAPMLDIARELMVHFPTGSALRTWAQAQCELLAAEHAESVLERRLAAERFEAARNLAEPLLRNARVREELRGDWLKLHFGDVALAPAKREESTRIMRTVLEHHFVNSALGSAQYATGAGAIPAAREAAAACLEFGLPPATTVDRIHAALANLPVDDPAFEGLLARFTGRDRLATAVSAVLHGLRARGSTGAARDEALEQLDRCASKAADAAAWTCAFADMIALETQSAGMASLDRCGAFFDAFSAAERELRGLPRRLAFRAHFEPTLGRITHAALTAYERDATPAASRLLSTCLEATRSPFAEFRADLTSATKPLTNARNAAVDWLGRLRHAIGVRPEAIALVPVTTHEGTWLLAAGAVIAGEVEIHRPQVAFDAAAAALVHALRVQFEGTPGDLESAARAAFSALPARLRKQVHEAREVLIAPDSSSAQAAVPYELLHDGTQWLGVRAVVARAPSLRDLVRAFEPSIEPAAGRARAVCVAAPHGLPAQPLWFAAGEVEAVADTLRAAGWDVPDISENDLDAELMLSGLELASLLHVAAHGDLYGGAHALVLPCGEKLASDAVERRRAHLGAAVILSACSVGGSEYLGAGVSRGLALALMSRGAPAVVASQWPMQDAGSPLLAETLVTAALEAPLGEALRRARATALEKGIPAALWGSLILIGDPWHRIDTMMPDLHRDAVVDLLRSNDPLALHEADPRRFKATARLKSGPATATDLRLHAARVWLSEAAHLVQSESPNAEIASELAALASDLGHPAGEALCRIVEYDLRSHAGDLAGASDTLDRAIGLVERLGHGDERWSRIAVTLLARRQRDEVPIELPEYALASGMKINDSGDPAVRAVLEIQSALDQKEKRRFGALPLHFPAVTLDELCWNAVTIWQRVRFVDGAAIAALSAQFARSAAAAGWVAADDEPDARMLVAGMLDYLWSSQHITALQRERATMQAHALRAALDRLADPGSRAPDRSALQRVDAAAALLDDAAPTMRLGAVRERLRQRAIGAPQADPIAGLRAAIDACIEAAPANSAARALRAAWCAGRVFELMRGQIAQGAESRAAALKLSDPTSFRSPMDDLMGFFTGDKQARTAQLEPLFAWRH